jgi:hypothetical protein
MLQKSKTLFGYSFFVDLARQYMDAGCELEEAIRRAVEDCIGKGILNDFLRDRSSEVINMLTAEFKLEDALQVWKEEGKIEVARSMLADGFPTETIRKHTGLGEKEILAI